MPAYWFGGGGGGDSVQPVGDGATDSGSVPGQGLLTRNY